MSTTADGPDPELTLRRFGFRFQDRRIEAAYAAWSTQRAVPFVRIGMVAAVLNYVAAIIAIIAGGGPHWQVAAITGAPIIPVFVFGALLAYRKAVPRWLLGYCAAANLIAGFQSVYVVHYVLENHQVGLAGTAIVAFFGTTIFRLRPRAAALAVGAYVIAQALVLLDLHRSGQLSASETTLAAIMPFTAYAAGMFACVVLDRVSRESYRQESTITRQTMVIEQERERADRLLAAILPAGVREQLEAGPAVVAESFDATTVLFADIAGFTPFAAKISATKLVEILDGIFTRFDDLSAHHGVEKIKTIGDAYMAAAGVPVPDSNHAARAADLALAIRDEVAVFSSQRQVELRVRIGLCSGPVVAGVIGRDKFAYDLWGDTVNTAARMESHGLEGEIQVAETTYRLLRDTYLFRERGSIEVKGKGPMQTYLLMGKLRPGQTLEPEAPARP